ncbi:MAG: acyl--CoA ligase [Clostridiales bacterium]|nr:acyl--CoA ligase [Clostridiales bacterium]
MVDFRKYTDENTFAKIVDYKSVGEMWKNSVASYPDDVAIVDGEALTYKQLDEQVCKMRAALQEKGIVAGDNVGILMPNSTAFAKAFLAITTLGAVAVLLPAHLDAMTVFGCSMKFGLKALIYAPALQEKTAFAAEKNPRLILLDETISSDKPSEIADVDGSAPCCVLFTGGTTGRSKGVLLSHSATMRGVKNGCYGYQHVFGQRYFLVLPLTHVFGLVRNLLTNFYTGSAIYICRNTKDMFKEIAVFKPTIMVLVPALAEMALNLSKQFGRNMLGADLKTIICGAAAVAPYLVREYDKFGVALLPGYGLTESANLVSGNPEALRKADSVGYIYEGMEYKIVDGELWLKGVNMMDGYVGEPEENAIAYEDGWFKTGDLVRMDEEGFLYITGRKKEIIVLSNGENVSPAELETKFGMIDTVQDCLVYETDGVLAVEILPRMAVVKALAIEDVEGHFKAKVNEINETLPAFMRVNKVIIRTTDFVRSPSMKIVRNQNANDKK